MRRVFAIAALAMLSACAPPKAPVPPDAAIAAPAGWRNGASNADAAVAIDWWKSFGDPSLAKMVETALAHNDDIAIAAARVAEARGQFRLARAQELPNIGADAQFARDASINPGFGRPETQTEGEGAIRISYDLDLFGRLADSSEAARAALLASQAAQDNVRLAVAASAASGYIALRALDARLVVLRDTLAARAEELRVARRRADAGYSSLLDLTQAEAAYRATEPLIPATLLAIARQEDGLSLLLGMSPRAIERGAAFDSLAISSAPAMVPASLLRRRPDIAVAEAQLAASDHSLDAARDAFMPDVQLAAAGGLIGSNLALGSPFELWSLGGSILAPIFSAGRLEAQQDIATARRDQAAFAYRRAALNAFREVEDALVAVQRDEEQERSLSAQRDVQAHALQLATNRYRAGYSPYLDQIDAQRGLLSVQLALVQARADRLTALVLLYQALGGGWHQSAQAEKTAQLRVPE
ncbi:MAG TPA: efflux transporter outer membrane subunit [Rhizomicrobium sp.]|nr:efflux transporter outer membrane subunit [Rhizomicrobium sp.]